MEKQLSIITIAYEETADLYDTYESIGPFLSAGTKWILVINKGLNTFKPTSETVVVEGKDMGLYDALNLGIDEVKTDYYMLLHSGDTILDREALLRSLLLMNDDYDCVLGGSVIGNRTHKSMHWQRWMLKVYVQPPHLPIIYRTLSCGKERYDISISTVSDYYFLKELFLNKKVSFTHSNEVYVNMSLGGLTTSGLKSFTHVTQAFMAVEGIKPLLVTPIRLLLKILLR